MKTDTITKKSAKNSLVREKENILKIHSDLNEKSNSSIYSEKKVSNSLNIILKKIVVENFKSFKGKREIGEFLNFSVILGPNGSGKSNILDAICFGLGIRPSSLRTNNLKELIYKNEYDLEQESKIKKQQKSCSVELYFEQLIKDKSSQELVFKRTIINKGASEYYLNNVKINQEEYLEKLEKLKFPSLARFYILLQGSIDSLISKKNTLTQTFEQLSGSIHYKEHYDTLRTEVTSTF